MNTSGLPSYATPTCDPLSLLQCFSQCKSTSAFQVITPQIGYHAIFIKLPDEGLLEPDMLLMMPRKSFSQAYPC